MKPRKMVLLSVLTSLAVILHVVEYWIIVPAPVPGIKLGLANVIAFFVLVTNDFKSALSIGILRVVLGSFVAGTFFGPVFFMSLGGAVSSILVMGGAVRYFSLTFSLMGISIIGASIHNIVQIIIAMYLMANASLIWYLPYLLIVAIPTGWVTGITVHYFAEKFRGIIKNSL